MKLDTGEWRENTAKESMREIRKHIVAELAEVRFEELTAGLLRALLKKKAEQSLGRQTLNHLRFYLTDICKSAIAEGYLTNNVSEGLKPPAKVSKASAPKLVATLEQYAEALRCADERTTNRDQRFADKPSGSSICPCSVSYETPQPVSR